MIPVVAAVLLAPELDDACVVTVALADGALDDGFPVVAAAAGSVRAARVFGLGVATGAGCSIHATWVPSL
jgi:hypothetical protein